MPDCSDPWAAWRLIGGQLDDRVVLVDHAARAFDQHSWTSVEELGSAMFEWIEAWCNPRRRHTSLGMLALAEYEALHTTATPAA